MRVIYKALKLFVIGHPIPQWQLAFRADTGCLSIRDEQDPVRHRITRTARFIDPGTHEPLNGWPVLYSAEVLTVEVEMRVSGYERVWDGVVQRDCCQTWALMPIELLDETTYSNTLLSRLKTTS